MGAPGGASSPAGPGWPASGSSSTPMFEDARLFRRGIGGRERRGAQGDVRVHRPRRTRRWRCAPRARPRSCGPSSSTTRPCPGRRGTSPPPSATSGPRPGGTGSTTSSGVEVLGTDDPDVDVEVIALAAGFYAGWGSGRSTWPSTPWAAPSAGRVRRRPGGAYLDGHAGALCDEHRERFGVNPLRVLDCKRPECRAVTEDAPRITDYLDEACAAHLARVRGRARRAGRRPPARAPARAGPRLLHPDHLRVLGHVARPRPRTPWAGAGATTGWPRPSAASPTPGHRVRHRHRTAAAGL